MVEGGMVLLYETGSLFKGFMYEDLRYYCENNYFRAGITLNQA